MALAMQVAPEVDDEPWVPLDSFGTRLAIVRQVKGWNVAPQVELDAC